MRNNHEVYVLRNTNIHFIFIFVVFQKLKICFQFPFIIRSIVTLEIEYLHLNSFNLRVIQRKKIVPPNPHTEVKKSCN